jgi:hypothetical protein
MVRLRHERVPAPAVTDRALHTVPDSNSNAYDGTNADARLDADGEPNADSEPNSDTNDLAHQAADTNCCFHPSRHAGALGYIARYPDTQADAGTDRDRRRCDADATVADAHSNVDCPPYCHPHSANLECGANTNADSDGAPTGRRERTAARSTCYVRPFEFANATGSWSYRFAAAAGSPGYSAADGQRPGHLGDLDRGFWEPPAGCALGSHVS